MPVSFLLRSRLLSTTCLTALAVLAAAHTAQAQSVIINDARVTPQNLDTLLPPASPKTGAITNTGSVLVNIDAPAVVANTPGWTLANDGTVTNGNLGPFAFGINFDQGGTITNNATGYIAGVYGIVIEAQPGVVSNSGTITGLTNGSIVGGGVNAIDLQAGGTVTNNAGGLITSNSSAVKIAGGGAVSNNGSIVSGGFQGIFIAGGGTVDNQQGGYIQGAANAVQVSGGGTVTNAGTVVGTNGTQAVLITGIGTITNTATGVMVSGSSQQTVSVGSGAGVINNAGSITNANTVGNFAAGAAVYAAGSTINNQAGGYIAARANGIYVNSTGSGATNAGRIESSTRAAAEFNAGGVFVNSGTVTGLAANAGVQMAGNTNGTHDGTITNSGTIGTTSGAVAIQLSNASHTLNLDTGSVINGNVAAGAGAGIDVWNLLGTGSETLDKFQGFETFAMKGTDWTVTGTGTIGTSSQIETGILRVNGTFNTPTLTVLAPGTLAGSGTVVGNVLNDAGTLAPGSQTTVLTIQGNLTMGADSTYLVNVDPSSATRTNVTGMGATATLQGGTVQVNIASGTYMSNTEYVILHADGGITGSFDPTVPQQGNFRFSLRQDEGDVFLTLLRFAFNDPLICATRNQCAVGTGLENVAPGVSGDLLLVINTLGGLDVPGQQRGLAAMAGDQHATLAKLALEGNALFGQSISRRLAEWRSDVSQTASRDDNTPGINVASAATHDSSLTAQLRQGPMRSDGYGVWMRGYGVFGSLDDDGNAAGVEYDIGGAAMGIDHQFSPNFLAGVSFGYANTKARFDREGARAKIDSYDLGLYAGFRSGGFRADTVLSYAWLDNDTSRNIPIGPIDRTAKADYGGHRFGAGLDLGYALRLGPIEIEPQAGLQYTRLKQNSFDEKGAGAISLDVDATKVDSLRSSVGARLAVNIPLGNMVVLVPELRGRWQHEFLDDRGRIDAQFAGQPASAFTADGVDTPADSAVLGGGVLIRFSQTFSAFVDYDAKLNKRETVHNVTGGLRLIW